jgi:hypothetical protein
MRHRSNPVPVNRPWVRDVLPLAALASMLAVVVIHACGLLVVWFAATAFLGFGALAWHTINKAAQVVGQQGAVMVQSGKVSASAYTGAMPETSRITELDPTPRIAGRVGAPAPRDGA